MPATHDEILAAARSVARQVIAPDCVVDILWEDETRINADEAREVFALALYELRRKHGVSRAAQNRALALLKSLLPAEQRRRLSSGLRIQGSLGGMYRLHPQTGSVWQLEKHGKHWFGVRSFCIHDAEGVCPPADTTIAHILLLVTDEASFLQTANPHERPNMAWNGDYLRRMRRCRLEREAQGLTP